MLIGTIFLESKMKYLPKVALSNLAQESPS